MKILIVPDSFKGSLTAEQVCTCIEKGIKETNPQHDIVSLPFADGGEGFCQCMADICNGETLYTTCTDIYGKRIKGSIVVFGDTAVIDTATASGIQPVKRIMTASSYGTGELIKYAYDNGFKQIILGLGGTGCCDGGMGALAALGVKFYDENYQVIRRPKGTDLNHVFGIGFKEAVKGIHFTFACDVNNPYCGENGAAPVFAPQKGANQTEVTQLEEGLQRLNAFLPVDLRTVAGSGAAGGIAGALYAVYGGEMQSGFDLLSQCADLENKIKEADLVITGEGKTDAQTLMGKLPFKVAELCRQYQKECVVISGSIDGVSLGDRMFSLCDENTSVEEAVAHAEKILFEKSKRILQS